MTTTTLTMSNTMSGHEGDGGTTTTSPLPSDGGHADSISVTYGIGVKKASSRASVDGALNGSMNNWRRQSCTVTCSGWISSVSTYCMTPLSHVTVCNHCQVYSPGKHWGCFCGLWRRHSQTSRCAIGLRTPDP